MRCSAQKPDPSEHEVRYWLSGNLCRCTGYDKIVRAVLDAAAEAREERASSAEPRKFRYVGTRPVRPDGIDKVTGRAQLRRGSPARPACSTAACCGARTPTRGILRIDVSAARAVPGVNAVVTSADLPALPAEEGGGGESPVDYRDLSRQRARPGEGALSRPPAGRGRRDHSARRRGGARAASTVDYEVLPPVLDLARRDGAGCADPPSGSLHEGRRAAARRAVQRGDARSLLERGDLGGGLRRGGRGGRGASTAPRPSTRATSSPTRRWPR